MLRAGRSKGLFAAQARLRAMPLAVPLSVPLPRIDRRMPTTTSIPATVTVKPTTTPLRSFASGPYVDGQYAAWKRDPSSVHKSWQLHFANTPYTPGALDVSTPAGSVPAAKVLQLVRAFQVQGHLIADLDPLGLMPPRTAQALDLAKFGLSEADLARPVDLAPLEDRIKGFLSAASNGPVTLGHIHKRLKETYCASVGYEYMHIPSAEECNWLRSKIETPEKPQLSVKQRVRILDRLTWADHFERFLELKYKTKKRFGLEGAESLIPGMKALIDRGADSGVRDFVVGMPHRGRLGVLASVFMKPLESIFQEFKGDDYLDESMEGSGDVKYHLGKSHSRTAGANEAMVHLSLLANPSHLEAVDPVVSGKVRAKQEFRNDTERTQVLGIQLHGDAAFSAQGVVYETMGMSQLPAYTTGGSIHVVVNNQVGFTTNPAVGRSFPYCTDLAKTWNCPIFHVNGDDPEAVVFVHELAAEWRNKFKKDVVIDLVCYRKHGHNELDEPSFTQPVMYRTIGKMPSTLERYTARLLAEGVITTEKTKEMSVRIKAIMEEKFAAAMATLDSTKHSFKGFLEPDLFGGRWKGFKSRREPSAVQKTGVDAARLKALGEKLYALPADFTPHHTLKTRTLDRGLAAMRAGKGIEWGPAEALAFGTLLQDGYNVRLSGQDVERGTFSHRYAVLHDSKSVDRKTFTPLHHISPKQGRFSVSNSSLSEFGVLGFETGYALEDPTTLTLWEAQFGDFFNTAQVMVDQFIASGENKWGRQLGLVMLLPHGYEGAGPEHSSARLERFLEAVDEHPTKIDKENTQFETDVQNVNWQVVNITTTANYFHVLRRQLLRQFRKPLVVMSPKSLLRFAPASSNFEEFALDYFRPVIPDNVVSAGSGVRRVIFCSGRVYYDLALARELSKVKDVAIARIEQLAPFPFHQVAREVARFPNAEVLWVQEESKNMGAYTYVVPRFEAALATLRPGKDNRPRYVGRIPSAATASGLTKTHKAELAHFVGEALGPADFTAWHDTFLKSAH